MLTRHGRTRSRWQRYSRAMAFSPLLLTTAMTGCAKDVVRHVEPLQRAVAPPAPAEPRYPSLAGTWAYEESGKTILITLNEQGHGTYEWKDGEFMTTTYSHGLWRGTWSQRENDRDGGFEVVFAEGRSDGEGRWWYTRIGEDTAPRQPGGIFQIERRSQSPRFNLDRAVWAETTRQARSRERP